MKWILWMILFVCISLQAISVTDYFERPTPAQIDQYYQDKAAAPWRYTYNPLQVGDQWYYSGDSAGEPIPTHLGRSVTADSLINGIQHYFVNGGTSSEDFYECNQGDSMMVYVEGSDQIYWVFHPGESFYPYWYPQETVCPDTTLISIFGQTVAIMNIYCPGLIIGTWAEMFGPIGFSFDFGETGIVGCIIDGVTYGTVPTSDEQLPAMNILSISAYPNPFRQSVNIQIKGKSHPAMNYAIYNLKGQIVRSWQNINADEIVWDGRDASGKMVSPGIYFIQAEDKTHTAVSKLLRIE